ncbi:hypothetical protein OOU_Y34scaffold00868g1 [Pyricularia oryzae Y34]|nr:hypothetical protein OOU_Y34scaffold00868g1 [Pyricularia oryzae Y34]
MAEKFGERIPDVAVQTAQELRHIICCTRSGRLRLLHQLFAPPALGAVGLSLSAIQMLRLASPLFESAFCQIPICVLMNFDRVATQPNERQNFQRSLTEQ